MVNKSSLDGATILYATQGKIYVKSFQIYMIIIKDERFKF